MPIPASAPSWAPTLDRVGNYVPRRTIVAAGDGYANPTGTFSANTHPTDTQVTQLIADACAWVLAKTGPLDPAGSLDAFGTSVAAKYAAAMAEQGYPDNRDDLSLGDSLYRQALAERDDLARANEAITGTDPEDPTAQLVPVYSFPDPFPGLDEEFN